MTYIILMDNRSGESDDVESVQRDIDGLAQGVELSRALRETVRNIVLEFVSRRVPSTKITQIRADPSRFFVACWLAKGKRIEKDGLALLEPALFGRRVTRRSFPRWCRHVGTMKKEKRREVWRL